MIPSCSFGALSEMCLISSGPYVRPISLDSFCCVFTYELLSTNLFLFYIPSTFKKTSLIAMTKEKLGRFFCIDNHNRANLLLTKNLMATGLDSIGDILARAKAVASIE